MTELEALRAEVAKLREEIADLRRSGVTHHHHYHQPAPWAPNYDLAPVVRPYYPDAPIPVTCGGFGFAPIAYNDVRMTRAGGCEPISPTIHAVATYHPPGAA